jgi:PTS system nitrogen regulatory IIA component
MRIADVLSLERMTVSLEATDKPSALRAIAELFSDQDPEAVYRVFAEREALASTGVGSGVAIPHGRLAQMDHLEAAVAIHPDGVPFDAVDQEPARLFIALLAPVHQAGEHLKALARFSRILRQPEVRTSLLEAGSREDALAVLLQQDARHSQRPPR